METNGNHVNIIILNHINLNLTKLLFFPHRWVNIYCKSRLYISKSLVAYVQAMSVFLGLNFKILNNFFKLKFDI